MRLVALPRSLARPLSIRLVSNLNRPSPISLPREQQREFEDLVRRAQSSSEPSEADVALHPDAREPVKPEFEGDVNPATGERGGPKREPIKRWVEGDWSFKGRVSDF
ncbi:hypothetical protein AX17_004450 [Amanita inopinata Kibby_2008]|nr:hypothetical protein AX17_004450 [Amanita inopinata Kibby_2008]